MNEILIFTISYLFKLIIILFLIRISISFTLLIFEKIKHLNKIDEDNIKKINGK